MLRGRMVHYPQEEGFGLALTAWGSWTSTEIGVGVIFAFRLPHSLAVTRRLHIHRQSIMTAQPQGQVCFNVMRISTRAVWTLRAPDGFASFYRCLKNRISAQKDQDAHVVITFPEWTATCWSHFSRFVHPVDPTFRTLGCAAGYLWRVRQYFEAQFCAYSVVYPTNRLPSDPCTLMPNITIKENGILQNS